MKQDTDVAPESRDRCIPAEAVDSKPHGPALCRSFVSYEHCREEGSARGAVKLS